MIGYLEGRVINLSAPVACVLTASGVGYDIELPIPAFCQLQLHQPATVWTHLHVREDAQRLYGFSDQQHRDVFRQLIKINGVGAKMALAMLSNLSVGELKTVVDSDDESGLVRIPGIGKKTAQRLLIELKDKLKNVELTIDEQRLISSDGDATIAMDVNIKAISSETKSALLSLGYREKEAEQAIKLVRSQHEESFENTQSLLKATLQQLSK